MAKGKLTGVYVTGRGKRRTTFRVEILNGRGEREYLGTFATEDEAYAEGARARRRVLRGNRTWLASTRMTVNELIVEHYLPSVTGQWKSGNTYRTAASHLGDGTGVARGRGRKAEQGAKFAIRTVFGHRRINDVRPADVLAWQTEMVEAGYAHDSLLAKKGYLRDLAVPGALRRLDHPAHPGPGEEARPVEELHRLALAGPGDVLPDEGVLHVLVFQAK